jgi:putative component of membrane protein insertase Oxa1/YidC/SpoIIIJ protein YidD
MQNSTAQFIIDSGLMNAKRIPGFLPGILFCFLLARAAHANPTLAAQLFQEADWRACAQESRRALLQDPADETAQLLAACATHRLGRQDAPLFATLQRLADQSQDSHIRSRAALELGLLYYQTRQTAAATAAAVQAFVETPEAPVFIASGDLLEMLLKAKPDTVLPPHVAMQLKTYSAMPAHETPQEIASLRPNKKPSLFSLPVRGITAFYRHAIRPAIGSRCSLHPSCSEYFTQAGRRHGLLAFPMIADRLVREPGVVNQGADPVQVNTKTYYRDPVEQHDEWME